jgi:hypothetical protein
MSSRSTEAPTPPEETTPEPVGWLWFLPRWSLLVGLVTLTLPLVLVGGIGQQASDQVLGADYLELLQAVRSPGMYRLGWTIDAIIWILIGGILLALAGILRRHAPIRATFVAVSGVAQLLGLLAGFLRLGATSDLASSYATAPADAQSLLLDAYLNLWRVIDAHYHVAVLFLAVGYLVAAWSLLSLPGFPRWLAAWMALPGLLAAVQFLLVTSGVPFSRPINLAAAALGNVALNFAIAAALWRPAAALLSAVATARSER